MNMESNELKHEIDTTNHVLMVYQCSYKLLGWILIVASILPLAMLLASPPWPITVTLLLFGAVPLAIGLNLAGKERRKRWDIESKTVVTESRWPGQQFKSTNKEGIANFEEIQILATPTTNRPGVQGSPPGVMVRLRHKRDSEHTYPGVRSWVLGIFPNKDYRKDAEKLAEVISEHFHLPIKHSLAP